MVDEQQRIQADISDCPSHPNTASLGHVQTTLDKFGLDQNSKNSSNNKTPNHHNSNGSNISLELSRRASNEGAMPKNNGNEIEVHNDNSNDSLSAALSFFDTSRSADRFLDSVLENSNR